jgi:xanthine/CO dehydrogenase XdhC/CoxF family maturation factor
MDRREIERILDAIDRAASAGSRVALATVVRVKGNAYRREGARIVVREDGSYECLLSGGCLEPAVAERAARVIATGEPVVVDYDLAEDSVWGLGIGCTGAVDIRIERVEDDPLTRAWLDVLRRGDAAVLVTPLAAAAGRLLVTERSEVMGRLDDTRIEAAAVVNARALLRLPHARSGPAPVHGAELFFEVSVPPPELVIFGAGPDAPPLARQARDLGFVVTVIDVREAMLTADRFPGARLRAVHFSRFAEAIALTGRSHVVVMNHHMERDQHSLAFALASDAAYIGVLGPRSRYQKLVERLAETGDLANAERLSRVRSPVGLALGAETPGEIAVSILGEIIAVRRGFEGGFLSGRDRSLHWPDDNALFARS